MKGIFVSFKGIRRKVNTKLEPELVEDIKTTLKDIKKGSLLTATAAVYGGGFHTKNNIKNVKQQLNRLKELHNCRIVDK